MRKCLALLMILCLLLPSIPSYAESSPGAEAVAKIAETGVDYPSLADALNAAEIGDSVEVLRDVDLDAPIEIVKNVTLLASKDVLVRRTFAGNRPMVKIQGTASLTLIGKGGSLTFDGRAFAGSDNSVVSIEGGGTLRIESGAALTGGNTQYGGGVFLKSGRVEVAGGRITGNIAQRGGGVYNEAGSVLVTGGEVTDNRVTFDGGGILSNKGSVSISGGEIAGNFAGGMGGGVCNRAQLELSGGRIGGNSGTSGGGVYNNATFRMTGGQIDGNASQAGGGILNGENGTFDLAEGSVSGNTSTGMGGGLFNQGACELDGGEIADNTASSTGGGVNNLGVLKLAGGAVKGNRAQRGGGVHQAGSLTVTGCGFESNRAELGGGIFSTANSGTTLLDTSNPFVDSVLYFEKAPIVNQTVFLTLNGNAAGAVAVQRGEWAEEGWFQLSGMEGSSLKQVPFEGSYALRLFQATVTAAEALNVQYGETFAPTATVNAGGAPVPGAKASFAYAARPEGPFTDDLPKDAGSYWVKARYEGDDQAFLMPSEGVSPFEILPGSPTVTLDDMQFPYTGEPVSVGTASVKGALGETLLGEIIYAYYSDPACGEDSLLPSPPVEPGEYYVKATVAAGENYAEATSAAAKLTIGKLTALNLAVPEGAVAEGDGYKLIVSDALQLTPEPTPVWADYPVQYTSSDSSVAAVDESGLVKATGEGTVTITAAMVSPADGERFESSVFFRVANEVAKVELPAEVQLLPGKTRKLSAKLSPASAPDKTLTWTVDAQPGIASVAGDGTVTAGDCMGVAVVTATAANGRSASCSVYVTDPAKSVAVRSQSGAAALEVNGTLQLNAEVLPESAYQRVNWTSTNKYTAAVDENGLVRAIKPGKVILTATAKDGTKVAGTFALEVVSPVSAVSLPETAAVLTGKSTKLTAKISPKNATDKSLRWSSDNPCAKVNGDGVVTGVSNGTAVITASSGNGLSASCKVTVKTLAESILLTAEDGQTLLYPGETVKLNATLIPTDASEVKLTWRSTVYRIIKANGNGEVTAYRPGQATITAEAAEGDATGSITLTVLNPAPSITLNAQNAVLSLSGENTLLLTASSPRGTQFRALNWAVASGSAVTVDNHGLVTAIAEGEALVRVTTDLGVYAECAITVHAETAD